MDSTNTTCWTCGVLTEYSSLTSGFADNLSGALHDPMLILFTSLTGLWMVIIGYKLIFKLSGVDEFIKGFVFISITAVLFTSQASGLISHVYSSALSIMGASSKVAFDIAGGPTTSSEYTGLVALAAAGEEAVAKVFKIASAVASAGRLMNPVNWIYAGFLVFPYFLLVVAYSSQVVVAIFRAMMVAVLSPFLFLGFAFDWGRDMARSGGKTLLGAILVLFASTAALALTIFAVNKIPVEPGDLSKDALNAFASLTNPEFILILALGWIGTALMAEGVSLANSIAGTALTNTAAGIMTAGAAATGLASAKFAGRNALLPAANFAGKAGLAGIGELVGGQPGAVANGVMSLVDKFKNINKPGGAS
jgi:type IV secretion system protein TrbL